MMMDLPVLGISLCTDRHQHSQSDLFLDLLYFVHLLATPKREARRWGRHKESATWKTQAATGRSVKDWGHHFSCSLSVGYKSKPGVSPGLQLFYQPPEAHAGCPVGSALVLMAGQFCLTGLEHRNHKNFGIACKRNHMSWCVELRSAIATWRWPEAISSAAVFCSLWAW